jgi:hypothetical protein
MFDRLVTKRAIWVVLLILIVWSLWLLAKFNA